MNKQSKAWRRANRKVAWGIKKEEFDNILSPPPLSEDDRSAGFIGVGLFYGVGDDGYDNADPVLSGKVAWQYARKKWWRKTWQCEYIDFDKSDHIRLRLGAPPPPKGFYYAKFQPGIRYQYFIISQLRKKSSKNTYIRGLKSAIYPGISLRLNWKRLTSKHIRISENNTTKCSEKLRLPVMRSSGW